MEHKYGTNTIRMRLQAYKYIFYNFHDICFFTCVLQLTTYLVLTFRLTGSIIRDRGIEDYIPDH